MRPAARIIVEKPIGTDLQSACAINDAIAEVFDERQIYRIDHYSARRRSEHPGDALRQQHFRAAVQPRVRRPRPDHRGEEEGVGTRAGYYEQAGALRDMVQNHMLQLLSLVAMEPPHSLGADVIRDEKLEVLQSLRPLDAAGIDANVVRAQYAGYRGEGGVDPASRVETFVALQVFVDNWRWAGVPFFLRTGKRLPKRASEISIHLQAIPPISSTWIRRSGSSRTSWRSAFSRTKGSRSASAASARGRTWTSHPVKMDFHYGEQFGLSSSPEAYERLILDVMHGDPTLFMRRDAVETAWRWVMPVLEHWAAQTDAVPDVSGWILGPGGGRPPHSNRPAGNGGRSDALSGHRDGEAGREEALDRAIETERSAAARWPATSICATWTPRVERDDGRVQWVEVCYCATPLAEEREYWEPYFTLEKGAGRARAQPLPRSERHGAVGVRRLRLHRAPRAHLARKGRRFR
jgi:glucose-6-phosphate 1-dehydrogenase